MKTTKQQNNKTNYHKYIMKLCVVAYMFAVVCMVVSCKKDASIVAQQEMEKVQK